MISIIIDSFCTLVLLCLLFIYLVLKLNFSNKFIPVLLFLCSHYIATWIISYLIFPQVILFLFFQFVFAFFFFLHFSSSFAQILSVPLCLTNIFVSTYILLLYCISCLVLALKSMSACSFILYSKTVITQYHSLYYYKFMHFFAHC